jgi:hypothetical protein
MTRHVLVVSLVVLMATLAGADQVRVTARKVTLHERDGKAQDRRRGTVTFTAKDVGYQFGLTRLVPTVTENVSADWIVLVEGAAGRLHMGTRGQQDVQLPLGKEVEIETGPIHLEERTRNGGPNAGSVESSIFGYALRVVDSSGAVLLEKYDPPSVKDEIDWKRQEQESAPPQDRPRRARRDP